jgi:hypothetical protein
MSDCKRAIIQDGNQEEGVEDFDWLEQTKFGQASLELQSGSVPSV